MSQEACRAAFAHNPISGIAKAVNGATRNVCGCENYSMADGSPGIVADQETLHLIISDPTDIQDGRLSPSSLIRVDTSGVSVLRENAANSEFELTLRELRERSAAANKPRSFLGVCLFSAHTVRLQDGARFMGVYDTALPGKDHHADILGPSVGDHLSNTQKERARRRRIKEMIGLIGRCFEPARSFRAGTFLNFS